MSDGNRPKYNPQSRGPEFVRASAVEKNTIVEVILNQTKVGSGGHPLGKVVNRIDTPQENNPILIIKPLNSEHKTFRIGGGTALRIPGNVENN